MIKLIASDIDGTLVKEGSHEIDPAYYDVIRELKEAGIIFCACSGRQYHSMMELFKPVADDIYFIASNGTVIRTRDRVLHSWKIDPELYLPLIDQLRTIEGAEIVVEGPDVSWIEGTETPVARMMSNNYRYAIENVDDLTAIPTDNIIKIAVHHPNVEKATRGLDQSIRARNLSMTISGAEWLDIFAKEAGKGEAFALLQEYLGIGQEETVYFGDNLNDLPAFHEAGVAATVANARSEMQDAADIVERSFSDLGVLKELRHILDLHKRFEAQGKL